MRLKFLNKESVLRFDAFLNVFFFLIWVFFHEHSRFKEQPGKVEAISLIPLYHFRPLHRHLDICRAITAESSVLHIAITTVIIFEKSYQIFFSPQVKRGLIISNKLVYTSCLTSCQTT